MSSSSPPPTSRALIIVMGVSGCGKSTTGSALASRLGIPFLDGDDLHPASNVQKMSEGIPLTDEDRAPWLARIRSVALRITGNATDDGGEEEGDKGLRSDMVVVGCSALKASYRDVLRGSPSHPAVSSSSSHSGLSPSTTTTAAPAPAPDDTKPLAPHVSLLRTFFIFIDGPRSVLLERMTARKGHFMKEKMLDSQLTTLEAPVDERGKGESDVVRVELERSVGEQVEDAVKGLVERGLVLPESKR